MIPRLLLMVASVPFTSLVLANFASLIAHLLRVKYDWTLEFFMVLGQLLFQFPFIARKNSRQKFDYFFTLLMVSGFGSVLLLPLLFLNYFVERLGDVANLAYFFAVVGAMFLLHKNRVKRLELPAYLSYTWVLYRTLILIFLLTA